MKDEMALGICLRDSGGLSWSLLKMDVSSVARRHTKEDANIYCFNFCCAKAQSQIYICSPK